MARHHLADPALRYLYREMLKENKGLPPEKRVGFQAWLRRSGIMSPEDIAAVERFEVASLDEYGDHAEDSE